MHTQPWVSLANPLGSIWVEYLRYALETELISQKELEREVTAGHVRPSLQVEVEQDSELVVDSHSHLRHMDRDFIPPYKRLRLGETRIVAAIRWLWGGVLRQFYRPPIF